MGNEKDFNDMVNIWEIGQIPSRQKVPSCIELKDLYARYNPHVLYAAETWTTTKAMKSKIRSPLNSAWNERCWE